MTTIYDYATKSWPVIKGCDMALPCAAGCWARRECTRLAANPNPRISEFHRGLTDPLGRWTGLVKLNERRVEDPFHWPGPQRVAVAYHGDWMLAEWEDIVRFWGVMAEAQHHEFLLLSKHRSEGLPGMIDRLRAPMAEAWERFDGGKFRWPLQNVKLGVSVSRQAEAEERIGALLRTAAAGRWVSLEPLLEAVDLGRADALPIYHEAETMTFRMMPSGESTVLPGGGWRKHDGNLHPWLDWVVVGGESGPRARVLDAEWVRSLREQCAAAGVPFWFKQWGEYLPAKQDGAFVAGAQVLNCGDVAERVGKDAAGCLLDGREWKEAMCR